MGRIFAKDRVVFQIARVLVHPCGMNIIMYSYPVCIRMVLEVALCFRAASVSCGLFEQYYGIRTNHDHNNNINILVDSARG